MSARAIDWLWFLLLASLGSAWCVTAGREIGPTFDEPFYLEQGLVFWRTGSLGGLLVKGTMPLPVVVTTAPVALWEWLRGSPVSLATEMAQALALARPATLVFWWLLIGYGWFAARNLGGVWAGRLAVIFLVCEPTLLANAALATTDVAVAACLLMLAVHFQAGRERTWRLRVALPALLYGVALLAKASALVYGVLIMAGLEAARMATPLLSAESVQRREAALHFAWRWLRDVTLIVGFGLTLTVVACGSDFAPEASFVRWAHQLPEGPLASVMTAIAENLAIFPNAGNAIARQIKHNFQGHGAYLLEQTAPRAIWYFFPASLSMKLATPLLFLPLVLLSSPRSFANRYLALAALFLLFSFNCRVQIGTRLVMPLVVFLIIGLSVALPDACARLASWRRPALAGAISVACVWVAISVASVWPHGLCFVNELWGGSESGYLCVGGSDYDWGQGFPELERRRQGGSVALLYYGTDPLADAPPYERLPPQAPFPALTPEAISARLAGRDLAVSVSLLYGPRHSFPQLNATLDYLRTVPVAERTTCFFIYRFPPSGAYSATAGSSGSTCRNAPIRRNF